jgi:cytoskeletal protein RodZ
LFTMTSGSKLSSSENIALKAISGVGLAIFTALMVVHWNNVLSKVEVAEETPPPATPSTTTNAAAAPPVPSASGVAPAATTTSAIATNSTTATPSTPVSSGTAPITTTPTTPTTATAPTGATTTPSTPVGTAPAQPSSLAAVQSTPPATSAPTSNFDAATLDALEVQLYDTLDKGWTEYPSFGQDLVYRVTVDADGNIVNYQPLHDAAVDYLNETPLDEVTPNSAAAGADFVVVMTPTGILEVDSWIGQ